MMGQVESKQGRPSLQSQWWARCGQGRERERERELWILNRGVHPSKANNAFPPTFVKCSQLFKKNLISSAKISHDFFSHSLRFFNFPPIFAKTLHFAPFRKIYYFSLFCNISSWFRWIYLFLTCFTCFSSPPTLTMMHFCIIQCTYWTLLESMNLVDIVNARLDLT